MSSSGRYLATTAVAAAVLVPGLLTGASAAAAGSPALSGGTWGNAERVPGLAALSHGQDSDLRSLSCGSAGNCGAGGFYTDASGHEQAYVVNQVNGTWGTAREVPGTAALNKGGIAGVYSVSCPSAGNCVAGGFYHDGTGRAQAFVVSETKGTWHTAQEVPGTAALNAGGGAAVLSVSCAAAGNCAAGGYYHDSHGHQQAFVVSQANGTWGTAAEVPGTAALNQGGFAEVFSVSCGAAGNCGAGGSYLDIQPRSQAFVVSETNGTWGTAEEVPGTAALEANGRADLASISCAAAGKCDAAGTAGADAFVVGETNGTWGTAEQVPGIAALDNGRPAEGTAMSCASPGNCSTSGSYVYFVHGLARTQVFVATETNGTWGSAETLPGIKALNQGDALPYSLSCGAPGNCATVGYYQQSSLLHPFVASQISGTWRTAQEAPGIDALTHGLAILVSVSCASAGNCSAGGDYGVNTSHQQPFVVSESTGP